MTIIYTKTVDRMDCYRQIDGETDVVFTIYWTLTATEGVYSCYMTPQTDVTYVAGQSFTPYDQLTEAQVIEWIDQFTPADLMTGYENNLASIIENQKTYVTPPLPWVA